MANFALAQREAESLIDKYKIARPPIDPEAIAKDLGVDVVYAEFNKDISDQISGYIDPAACQIVVNKAISASRKIYTIAHELGHYILHRDYANSQDYQVLLRRNQYEGVKPPEEQEADAFAANLLVPMKFLRQYKDVASSSELARLFCVSHDVILHRLRRA
jgi:Zn-dependent peptidase ImmA (M78 family)